MSENLGRTRADNHPANASGWVKTNPTRFWRKGQKGGIEIVTVRRAREGTKIVNRYDVVCTVSPEVAVTRFGCLGLDTKYGTPWLSMRDQRPSDDTSIRHVPRDFGSVNTMTN